jgi:uncharacterized protein
MNLLRCPTCKKPFDPAQTTAMPFCSDRCRQIDLNRWLKEEISMPISGEGEDEPSEEPETPND